MDFKKFFDQNLKETKLKIKQSFSDDLIIIQLNNSFQEINKILNILTKRIREWYSWYLPEISEKIKDNKEFIKLINSKSREDILVLLKITEEESMGKKFEIKSLLRLSKQCEEIYLLKEKHEQNLISKMQEICPNLLKIAGHLLGAKLISHAGSLKRLALMPSSTVQLLGAEKAFFRHLKRGTKSPKYGYIMQHDAVLGEKNKGKAARQLANQIVIAARKDFFKNNK